MNGFDPRLNSFSFRPILFFFLSLYSLYSVVFSYAVRLLETKKQNKNKQKTKQKTVKLPLYQIFVQCQLQVWDYKCEQQPIFHQSVKHLMYK